jgi:hypothetical protein
MKIIIQSTTKIVTIDGVPARVWEGETESGIKVHAYITRIAISKDEPDSTQFETELSEQKAPSVEVEAIPMRLIL